ncbi:MAG: phosphoglycerate mutase [Rhizobiales bacterium 65-9]|mgnify:CR=1 FL=1|nr:histidine phosphatase family protein [Hyphomicrobiales bacterium]OJY34296.1 MAG: phosphoglycerate mutase [Rhizobiales bacterium 65-9]
MRRLILLRHAKSDWPENVADHDRPLDERGRAQAPLMGRYLAEERIIPDVAIVSTARRTQETWRLASEAFSEAIPRRDEPRLYAASADMAIHVARGAEGDPRTLLMVGHNPSFHEAAAMLTGHGDRYAFARLKERFPTCAMAIIDFAVENWSEIAPRGGRLDRYLTPKSLGGEDAN